jgi:hypothetical protein
VKLDRRLRRDVRQLVGGKGVKRRALCQKPGDLAQAGVQVALPSVAAVVI